MNFIAKATMQMPDDFMDRISTLGNQTDAIVEKVLEAGSKVMLAKVKGNLQAVIGKTKYSSRTTGELLRSLGVSPMKIDKNGNSNIKIGFAEPRRDGGSNAKLANIIEYGKHGQPARPFLKPAKSAAKNECIQAMKSKLDEEINKA